ncbi:hypothetical protein GH733_000659 [Mirounga leonina]|nr:hypothetical protein GH733_000659 [Mirounga leonina]
MLLMKGTPQEPHCGFSKQMVEIFNKRNTQLSSFDIFSGYSTGVEYETLDVLEAEGVQQGLKAYSNWPTYSQLSLTGELVGGLDIAKELKDNGELPPILKGEN